VNVLVDTSVWSLALRRAAHNLSPAEKPLVAELAQLIREDRARLIGLVRQELLSGIKTPAQFSKLRDILRAFPDEPLDASEYEAAALASNECRSAGLAGSVVHILICSVARSRDWPIFTTDPDFTRYASILRLRLHHPRP
jgi:predicted nucleic acid-binding protein